MKWLTTGPALASFSAFCCVLCIGSFLFLFFLLSTIFWAIFLFPIFTCVLLFTTDLLNMDCTRAVYYVPRSTHDNVNSMVLEVNREHRRHIGMLALSFFLPRTSSVSSSPILLLLLLISSNNCFLCSSITW